jgi:hypothetical protein
MIRKIRKAPVYQSAVICQFDKTRRNTWTLFLSMMQLLEAGYASECAALGKVHVAIQA